MSENVAFKTRVRGHLRTRVTKMLLKVQEGQTSMSRQEKSAMLLSLDEIKSQLNELNKSISQALFTNLSEDKVLDEEWEACDSCNDEVHLCRSLLEQALAAPISPVVDSGDVKGVDTRLTKLKLPEIPLPKFSNAPNETLLDFLDNFESVINKYNLSDYEKFIYIKRQLEGEPLILINSLSGMKQSYTVAKSLLKDAFADSTTQKYSAIKRLVNLNLRQGTMEFISEFRVIQDLFKNLKIDVDEILQYFIWTSLSISLQTQIINICNANKPNLEQINDNIFKAVERSKEISNSQNNFFIKTKHKNVQNFATVVPRDPNSTRPPLYCTMCSHGKEVKDRSHSTKDCTNYKTPLSKLNKLRSISACIRCGFSNHTMSNCFFKFHRNCYSCGGDHMTFLCPTRARAPAAAAAAVAISEAPAPAAGSVKIEYAKSQYGSEVSSGMVWSEALSQTNIEAKTILPTFQMTIKNQQFQCLKDGGSQTNFIETALAETLDLPVKFNNYFLTVNGFNESKPYKTKVVSVPLRINDKEFHVNAFCVPKIKTRLKLPGLQRVARGFVDRGYALADPSLLRGDEIGDIRFVLGMSAPEVLLEKQVAFGVPPSVFSDTAAGVLLYGSVDRLMSCLPLLPVSTAAGGGPSDCSAASKVRIHSLTCHNKRNATHPETGRVSLNISTLNSKNFMSKKSKHYALIQNNLDDIEQKCHKSQITLAEVKSGENPVDNFSLCLNYNGSRKICNNIASKSKA